QILAETFERPVSFNLADFWEDWCAGHESLFTAFSTTVRVAPIFISILPKYFGAQVQEKVAQAGSPDEEGWVKLELSFESLEAARERILGFGRGVEVLEPRALRRSVLDMAEQIVDLYDKVG
ncbi:MAG: WYL domain-containing protein, partial [Candidatus Promineifilaceae bacterium]